MKKTITLGALLMASTSLLFAAKSIAGSWQQNVNIGGFSSVNIYTPDSTSAIGDGKSLMIVLHGCVQPISNYLTANLEDAAEQHGMVIAVPDAMNKAGYSCWSYWQGAINRTSGDYKNLINLANAMSGDVTRDIDPDQVYLTGLSSGGAFAQQAACVAPDIFAGVAPSAGPTLGTSSNGALNTCEVVTSSTFKSRCESYAGSYSNHLDDQIAVVGHGTADTTVDTCYNQQNANGYAAVYGVTQLSGTNTLADDATRTASETLWSNNRVAMIWFDGLDHSWSGGAGASGQYVAGNSINFATYLGQFFADNNLRVDRNAGPVISNHAAIDNTGSLLVSGYAVDAEGSVGNVAIRVYALDSGAPVLMETINTSAAPSDGYYSASSATLNDGLYLVEAQATDNESKMGDIASFTVRVGPEPAAEAPVISGISVAVVGQCATVTGTVVDANQNLQSVTAAFANGSNSATVSNNAFTVEQCNLPGGNNSVTVTATDTTAMSSSESASFTIDAGQTGDYNYHINEGHITWGSGYSACYLAFGTSDFTMREYPAGTSQCNWVADGEPSCKGPNQACSVPTTPLDSDGDGVADSLDNCPNAANANQADNDNDGIGNVCDSTPDGNILDADNDGVNDSIDNCPNTANADQADNDNDGIGNVCDATPDGTIADADSDGIEDALDNCPLIANADQADADADGTGDVCDATPNGDFACVEYTASNYSHVSAGRATNNLGIAYAVGSNDNLGLWNIFITTTLAQTSDGYYELGSCPAN
ncbi:PHB depolymerase family esterase [Thalassotalea litorea]|uniref:PHB depolymerase family esterase n=1 Tax=Thalassotalea litorea TaxID=2020715 RepID=A0A5R9IMJ6_9GAMM|nr:PHB depolymerase family esterase [Thalassotalea litorea]TLU65287.1 PHB depolymerase family esterase [Thalassotalea litorea]